MFLVRRLSRKEVKSFEKHPMLSYLSMLNSVIIDNHGDNGRELIFDFLDC